MKNCKIALLPLKVLFASLFACAAMTSCTEVDDMLGQNLIPEDQDMVIKIGTIDSKINTFLTRTDSIPASNIGRAFFGQQSSPVFGKTKTGALIQYANYGMKDEYFFGYKPIADSAAMVIYVTAYGPGKSDVEQTFNIYPVKKEMKQDSVYYPDIDVTNIVDFSEPLFTFKHKGKQTGEFTKMLTATTAGKAFLQSIVDYEDTSIFKSDTMFRKVFKGFYIRAANDSPEDANIFSVDLQNDYTYFMLFGHNFNKDSLPKEVVKDTIYQQFYMADGSSKYISGNLSLNKITHDYAGSSIDPAKFNDTLSSDPSQARAFVQCLVGATTYLNFTDEFISSLKALVDKTQGYNEIAVNKAMLVLKLSDVGVPYLNAAPNRLGMYFKYKGSNPTPIYDYQYNLESQYAIPYGGYLNRSHGEYTMDITLYVQKLLGDKPDRRMINLAPAMNLTYPLGFGEVELKGRGSAPSETDPKVVLTYTLIK